MAKGKVFESGGEEDVKKELIDFRLILLRQIDRINKAMTIGDWIQFINGIEALKTCLMPYMDSQCSEELKEATEDMEKSVGKARALGRGKLADRVLNAKIGAAQKKWDALMKLTGRAGLVPEQESEEVLR